MVDTLIATEWTQRRLRRIEAELWAHQLENLDQNLTRAEWTDPNFQHPSPLGRSYLNALEAFSRIQRRIESTNRMFLRTLEVLQDLQKAPVDQTSQPEALPPKPGSDEKLNHPPPLIGSVQPITAAPAELSRVHGDAAPRPLRIAVIAFLGHYPLPCAPPAACIHFKMPTKCFARRPLLQPAFEWVRPGDVLVLSQPEG